MDKNAFDEFFQERTNAVEASKTVLLSAIEKAKPASDTTKTIPDISEDVAERLAKVIKIGRQLTVETLAQDVREAFQTACQENDVAESLSGITTDDDQSRQDVWSRVTANINIGKITDNWLKNSKDILVDETVLEQARQYAHRILDSTIAFNWDWDGGPAFVVHQLQQETET